MPKHIADGYEYQVIIGEICQSMTKVLVRVEVHQQRTDPTGFFEDYREKIHVIDVWVRDDMPYEDMIEKAKELIGSWKAVHVHVNAAEQKVKKKKPPKSKVNREVTFKCYDDTNGHERWAWTEGDATYMGYDSFDMAMANWKGAK